MKLLFSKAAVNDLSRLREFIAQHSPEAAQRVAQTLIGAIKRLAENPKIGRSLEIFPGEIREMTLGKYVIRYEVRKKGIFILRIWHGKEDSPKPL